MRILHVIPYHPTPSSFIFSKRQVHDLQNEGHTCEVFYFDTHFSPIHYLTQHKQFKNRIKDFKPDIIHAHYGTVNAFFASIGHNLPFVVSFQGSDLNYTADVHPIREKLGKWMSKQAALRAQKIICVSQTLIDNLKAGKEKAIVIPSGVDIDVFRPMDRKVCIEKLNLDLSKRYIFFNANNPSVKRLDIAQEVCKQLSDYSAELLSLNGNVHPNEIPLYINASTIVLLCSDSEGSPMIIKEALACNVPIVATDVGDVRVRIEGVTNCLIVEQDVQVIADSIRTIFRKNEDAKTNGRERLIADKIDSKTIIRQFIALYNSIVKENNQYRC